MTQGIKSTEFWLTVVVMVSATFALAIGKIDAEIWLAAMAGVGGIYTAARGAVKVKQAGAAFENK